MVAVELTLVVVMTVTVVVEEVENALLALDIKGGILLCIFLVLT